MAVQTSDQMRVSIKPRPNYRVRVNKILLTLFFILLTIGFIFPLYWMVVSSLRPDGRIFVDAFDLLPSALSLDSYRTLFEEEPFGRWMLNSVLQTGGFAITALFLCTTGGYALAKFKFRGRNLLFMLILVSQMIPFHLLIVSLFLMIIQLGLVENYFGAIIPIAASPIGIFFVRQYMLSIDDEMLNAARVDGANEYQIFWSVVLPNARPAIATLFILFSLDYWNNLLWPLIVFRQAENMPLAVGITRLINQYRQSYDLVMAGSTLATIPIIILFLFLRRQVMEGLAATGTGMK
ncbi:MAG: carbohydrate ABC transporter permease [Anaerolineae bacterium]|jgi:ABC-type glycerol-3-phosphate transport system permease component|uniref:carbohydrate ABC transporter permease n=1 Tax=Candidatus Flexifilum breve TaxID=3140694 RepID=UPI001AD0673D|nr:carbohydrate ABC transporter permease [Chloroflexota bacterium]MBN8637918.1 carbohydrate ABC transporter permease [Anaerolineae bacterium]